MFKQLLRATVLLLMMFGWRVQADTPIVVITNPNVPKPDATTLQKVYTGKLIEIGGVPVAPANVRGGPVRAQFLRTYLKQDEDDYIAYWTVRRYIGKGAPPREIASANDMIVYVESTPGAIGYVEESELKAGAHVLVLR